MSHIFVEDEKGKRKSITQEEAETVKEYMEETIPWEEVHRRVIETRREAGLPLEDWETEDWEEKERKREKAKKLEEIGKKLGEVERKLGGVKANFYEDYEQQKEARDQFERSYGKGTVAVIRDGRVQLPPELPPPHLTPHPHRIMVRKKEENKHEASLPLPPEGHRTKRRK